MLRHSTSPPAPPYRSSHNGIFNGIDVDGVLVRQVVKHVVRVDRGESRLFVPKNEIDPQMQVGRDVIAFQCFAVNANEFTGVAMGPFWKHDVTQDRAVLSFPEVQLDEEGRRGTASISHSREIGK